MKNIIFNELLHRDYAVDVGVVEIMEKQDDKMVKKQCEIDFVVNAGAKKYYIQSALNIEYPRKKKTELRPLMKVNDFDEDSLESEDFITQNDLCVVGFLLFRLEESRSSFYTKQEHQGFHGKT